MSKPFLFQALCFVFGFSLSMWAQNPAATVKGRVTDTTKSGVPAAAVRIRSITTGESRQAQSGSGGEFTITNLAPDKYEMFMEKNGFRGLHETEIVLQVDQTARFELQLEVGAVTQTLEIKANVPLLNTENSTKGDVIVSQEISEMPLNGRSFSDLAYMVPSVEPSAQGGDGSGFNIGGARADQTNFMIDGFQSRNSRGGGSQTSPNLDAIQEFKMQTTGYSAEQGRLAGGVMNSVLKSGGNDYHGTVFEFLRNDVFDARNFFAPTRSPLRRNQFGAMLSGPVTVPHLANVSFSRQFRLNERRSFQLRWEMFNVTNHTNFLLPNTSVDVPAGGGITSSYDARIMQVGLKYIF